MFKSSDGAVFVQLNGANTRPKFVGCVDVDSLNAPGGAVNELTRCFKADGTGWMTLDATETAPEPVTTTITTLIEGSANSLELVRNGLATLFIHQRDGGRSDSFGNWTRSWILEKLRVGDRVISDLAMREEDNISMMAFGISALPPLNTAFQKTTGRQSVAVAEDVLDIHFCGVGYDLGLVGVAVTESVTGSPADKGDVLYTLDGGVTWTPTITMPFAGAENISSVTCFLIGRNTTRIVVARGSTDVANPMEIAYTDNFGATAWTAVNVGTVNGQFAPGPQSLFALDPYNMWVVAGAGYLYYSDDGGLTWTRQLSGITTVNNLWGVHFATDRVGYAVGAADTLLKTEDGGQSWTITTDNTGVSAIISALYVIDSDHVWVGTQGGRLFYTNDGGITWVERSFRDAGAGMVTSIQFVPGSSLFGFMTHNTAAPVGTIYSTIDGGNSWDPITTFTNAGLNGMAVIDLNTAFFTGNLQGGTGVIGKAFAKP